MRKLRKQKVTYCICFTLIRVLETYKYKYCTVHGTCVCIKIKLINLYEQPVHIPIMGINMSYLETLYTIKIEII